jgi:hypothetical protein
MVISWAQSVPLPNAFRVGVLKAVDGLVVVADYADRSSRTQKAKYILFGAVQVLVLVGKDVGKLGVFRGTWISLKILEQIRDYFVYEHCLM